MGDAGIYIGPDAYLRYSTSETPDQVPFEGKLVTSLTW